MEEAIVPVEEMNPSLPPINDPLEEPDCGNTPDLDFGSEVTNDHTSMLNDEAMYITWEDFEKQKMRIQELGFIELLQEERNLQNEKQVLSRTYTVSKSYLSTIEDMQNNKDLEDFQPEEIPDTKNVEEFLDHYETSMQRLDSTIEYVKERLHEFDDVDKTASFMNTEMLRLIDQKLELIDKRENSGEFRPYAISEGRTYFTNMKYIYEHPDSTEYLVKYVHDNGRIFQRLKRDIKADIKRTNVKGPSKNFTAISNGKNASKVFYKAFDVETMRAFEQYIRKLFAESNPNDLTPYGFQYLMYLIMTDKKAIKKGLTKWVDITITNVKNIIDHKYDLENGVLYYRDQLLLVKNAIATYM